MPGGGDATASSPARRDDPPRTTLSLGVMGRSQKENEHRLGLHPRHLERVPDRPAAADVPRDRLRRAVRRQRRRPARARRRRAQPRPAGRRVRRHPAAQAAARATSPSCATGQVLWGWPHCVQDQELTQLAIDRRLTLIAFEAMNHWKRGRLVQPARLPQEQRAGRLRLGAARHAARRHDRQLRTAAAGSRHRFRGDGPWGRHGPHRPRGGRRRHPHPPAGRRRGLADPLGADPALRPGRHRRRG